MKKDINIKIQSCEGLKGKTIADIVNTPHFIENLAAYMKAQQEDRDATRLSYEAMRKLGGTKGYKLPAHPCDKCLLLTTSQFAVEYLKIIQHHSKLPYSERNYIRQLCQQAYNKTVVEIILREFPELESELIPQSNEQN